MTRPATTLSERRSVRPAFSYSADMARLPFVSGHGGHFLCSGASHPFLHVVVAPAGSDLPLPTPADRSDDAVDHLHRIGPWFLFRQSIGVVAFRADEPGPWVVFDGMWGPVPASRPDRFWVTPPARSEALLVDGDGRLFDRVPLGGPGMVRADLAGILVVQRDDGTNHEISPRGVTRAWTDLQILSAVGDRVIAIEPTGRSLISMSGAGAEVGRVELEEGWKWSSIGSLSPDGRFYVADVTQAIAFEEVLRGRRPERRRVIGDLRAGAVVPVDPAAGQLGYEIWDPASTQIYATTFRELVVVAPADGSAARILQRPCRHGPLAVIDAMQVDVLRRAHAAPVSATLDSMTATRPGARSRPASSARPALAALPPEMLGSLTLPAVQLIPRYGEERAGRSHLGGAPRLPPDYGWPTTDDQPLMFVAQIDLAEVAGFHVMDGLPVEGLLTVWFDPRPEGQVWGLDPGDRQWWRVDLIDPQGARQVRPPPELPAEARTTLVNVQFASAATYLPPDLARLRNDWSSAELAAYEGLAWRAPRPDHHLLGHPRPIQYDDMARDSQLRDAGLPAGDLSPRQRTLRDALPEEDWRLLLQIESDSGAGFDFCGGSIYIWVPSDDLRAAELDRCWITLQAD